MCRIVECHWGEKVYVYICTPLFMPVGDRKLLLLLWFLHEPILLPLLLLFLHEQVLLLLLLLLRMLLPHMRFQGP